MMDLSAAKPLQGHHAMLDLSAGVGSDGDFDALVAALADGKLVVDAIDFRGNELSLDMLIKVCRALSTAAALRQTCPLRSASGAKKRTGRACTWQAHPPCWLDVGGHFGLSEDELVERLHKSGVDCCVPVRCGKKCCLTRAHVHLNVQAYDRLPQSLPKATPVLAPVRCNLGDPKQSPPPPIHARDDRAPCAPVPCLLTDLIGAHPGPPCLLTDSVEEHRVDDHFATLPKSESPFEAAPRRPTDFYKGQRVFATCTEINGGHSSHQLTVQLFEDLTVLLASPLAVLSSGCILVCRTHRPGDRGWVDARHVVGDPRGERAFELLSSRGSVDDLCLFLERLVQRLGGDVVNHELFRQFAASLCARQGVTLPCSVAEPISYQELLRALHDRGRRNAAGIRQPGDYYGVDE